MGHACPVYFASLMNDLRRNELFRGLDKIFGNARKSQKFGNVSSAPRFPSGLLTVFSQSRFYEQPF